MPDVSLVYQGVAIPFPITQDMGGLRTLRAINIDNQTAATITLKSLSDRVLAIIGAYRPRSFPLGEEPGFQILSDGTPTLATDYINIQADSLEAGSSALPFSSSRQ